MLAWRHTHRGWDGVSMPSERSWFMPTPENKIREVCGALDVRKACRVIGYLLIM